MQIFISNLLNGATCLLAKQQSDYLRGIIFTWLNHLKDKPETLTLNWEKVTTTNSFFMDALFNPIQEKYPALYISKKILHSNCPKDVCIELSRVFEYQSKYHTNTDYKAASNYVFKELSTIEPKP